MFGEWEYVGFVLVLIVDVYVVYLVYEWIDECVDLCWIGIEDVDLLVVF